MTHIQHRKVRYVKCPKCGRILPEPEQVPLYTCGGCDTILQAKYYRREKEALMPTVPTEDVVPSNSNGHAGEVGKSSGSSQRSSGEQSSIHNQDSDENAISDCNSEKIGNGVGARHASLSEESSELLEDSGEVVDKKLDRFGSGGKQAAQLPMENETAGGSDEGQYDGNAVEKQENGQIMKVNNTCRTSTRRESEVLENRKSQVKQDEDDEQELCEEVVALEKRKRVRHGDSAKEIPSTIQSHPAEKLTQFEPVSVVQGSGVSENELDCLAEEKLVAVAKLGNEDKSGKERIREKLESVTISNDASISTQVDVQDEIEASLGTDGSHIATAPCVQDEIEASLGTNGSHIATAPSSNSERTASNASQCETSLLDNMETSKQKIENFGYSNAEISEMADGNAVEKRDDVQISKVNNTGEISVEGESEVLENRKPQELAIAKEVKQDKNDKQLHCEDIALEAELGSSAKEVSMPVQPQFAEKSMQSGPVNMTEGGRVSGNSNGMEQNHIIERVRGKLASVTISNDGLMSTEVHNGNKNSFPAGEASLRNFDDSIYSGSGKNRSTNKKETLTKRSPAYDGSVSSCDGNDDHAPRQPEHFNEGSFPENYAFAGHVGVPSNRIRYGNWRTRGRDRSSSCQLPDEKVKAEMVEEQESVRENYILGYNRPRQHRDGLFPHQIPFPRRTSDVAFETGSSSSYIQDEPPSHWTRNHRDRHEDQEQWRTKTYGQREYVEGRRFPEAAWRGNDFLPPMYHNDERLGELYQKQRYNEYSGIRRQEESRSFSGNLPRTRYSGEVYNGRYQFQDARPWSAQLPPVPGAPPGAYYHHEQMPYMDHFGETSWDPYDTHPENPQRFLDFDSYGLGPDAFYLSDDQKYKDQIMKRSYMREKQQAMKRHLLPMAGAAPFIACRFCLRVLQLPEEFLVAGRKRIYSLKCGACSNILEFSLGNDSCLAPCLPHDVESVGTNPERDARIVFPPHASHSRNNGNDLLQHNSLGAQGREKSKDVPINLRTRERAENLSDGDDGVSFSDQSTQVAVTWNLPDKSKSPLHRLMGYSSPHDLLTEQADTDEE